MASSAAVWRSWQYGANEEYGWRRREIIEVAGGSSAIGENRMAALMA